ncbi:porphobilinogen deaminase [Fistulina hepatica ATCC 64428]|uniref:hydroxymethylbilane synthase n=1 Tax=Fistulina hepatica ATCC 64428 TaxID=1128425 RepID=A0A0D7A3F3_9AGAR|nr:porphobilinogen deaminase [Fistulina hepatica ATCC 64428]
MRSEKESTSRVFTLASRASQLAQIQTNICLAALQELYPEDIRTSTDPTFTTSFMTTAGDKNQSQALYLIGGKALWTKELEVALKEHAVDMLVHSLKDVPTILPEGCILGGVMEREDPLDSLVVKAGKPWKSLDDLPSGSVVGTSSVRRVAQLKRRYPGLKFLDVRGNLNTRMAKLDVPDGPFAALVLAKAGLVRLGMGDRITSDIEPPILYHAVSQGALGVEIRADDAEALSLCERITHRETLWRCLAERGCLRVLEGGCSVPVGVASSLENVDGKDFLTLIGCVTALDGSKQVEHTLKEPVSSRNEAEALGERVAEILKKSGAKEILDDINVDRAQRVKEAQVEDTATSTQ